MYYLEENKFLFKANPTNQIIHWRAIKELIKDNNSSGGKDTFLFYLTSPKNVFTNNIPSCNLRGQ